MEREEQVAVVDDNDATDGRRGLFGRRKKLTEDQFERRFSAAFARHAAQVRAERREESRALVPSIDPGPSNFARAQVPYGVDLAAAWSWRFVVIVAAGYLVARAVGFFSAVVLPLVIALFLAALLVPLVDFLARRIDRGVSAGLVVIGVIGFITLMLTFATQQVIDGATDLADQVVGGLDEIRAWLEDGPLNASDAQINDGIRQMQDLITTSNNELVDRLQDVGTAIGHIVAAFFIVLFATFFFLSDGRRIWSWLVRIFPRAARERADASGRIAWTSLTQFVRATVIVALVDAVGIMVVAAILDVPFVFAIGVLVFLGGFIPLVGATISGSVAILVALVDEGAIVALFMLGGVIAVQQLEAHVLQPFLLGRMVSVHPLAVILSIAAGAYFAGIAGALVAVPFVASLNAVAVYLSSAPDAPKEMEEDVKEETGEGVRPDPAPEPRP
ncbi:MAG: FIG01121868: Possible membrane protein, Rv0205 [uncultured Nocardioidaceae bacterium]|uniref:FIG01121868: Possible membrane protein, Rv0205 n=1 Tax=uncultured Nocardioidaceae bacterium TaxID=253824 RepID=A0A6J4NM79_9ACTN|nr:MAG: FIG01121868: Possible membrane protein, Rv0205 [uncultured Nocardioidaceae bacterium]